MEKRNSHAAYPDDCLLFYLLNLILDFSELLEGKEPRARWYQWMKPQRRTPMMVGETADFLINELFQSDDAKSDQTTEQTSDSENGIDYKDFGSVINTDLFVARYKFLWKRREELDEIIINLTEANASSKDRYRTTKSGFIEKRNSFNQQLKESANCYQQARDIAHHLTKDKLPRYAKEAGNVSPVILKFSSYEHYPDSAGLQWETKQKLWQSTQQIVNDIHMIQSHLNNALQIVSEKLEAHRYLLEGRLQPTGNIKTT